MVVATKVYHQVGDLAEGLSRAQILRSIDDSLRRLGMDYVDLLQIHRWDYTTPIEETLEALDEVVKAGKARYIGASSMHARQFARALALQQQNGWARFVTMQDHYNLIYREEENEMLPLCQRNGVAVIPWSPLARGRLTRLARPPPGWSQMSSANRCTAPVKKTMRRSPRISRTWRKNSTPAAPVALAWLLSKPGVAAPIIGPSRQEQLDDLLQAVDLTLSAEQIDKLEAPYQPHPVVGFK